MADPVPPLPADSRARIWIRGCVQGVGYRSFAQSVALSLGLRGEVRNLEDGRVEVEVEGSRSSVETLLEQLRIGPRGARVEDVQVLWESATGRPVGFRIWHGG